MTRFGWIVTSMTVVILVLAVALLMWLYGAQSPQESSVVVEEPARTLDPSSLAIYTSGTYGFSFFYPATAYLSDEFGSAPAADWRQHARSDGMLIVEVATEEGEVRLGMSTEEEEVASCAAASGTERIGGISQMGSTTWNVFKSSLVGTDAERDVRSYRTVRDGACYALEAYLSPGASLEESRGPALILESFSFAG